MKFVWFALTALVVLAAPLASESKPPRPAGHPQAGAQAQGASTRSIFARLKDNNRYWLAAEKEVYKDVPALIAQHKAEIATNLRYDKIMRGDPAIKEIAITFDDGPHPAYTPRILDILRRYNAKATFFLVGMLAEKYPDLVRAEWQAGHAIGNHTYHHVNLTKIPGGYVASEIEACGDVLGDILGKKPHLFRPPGGDYNSAVAQVAAAMRYRMVLWTDDPGDYASPGQRVIYNRVIDDASPGGIVLIHDGIEQTIAVLPKIITTLRLQGYKLVTVDQLMRDKQQAARARLAKRP